MILVASSGSASSNSSVKSPFKWRGIENAWGNGANAGLFSFLCHYATTERVHLGTLKSYPRYTHVEQITDGVRADMQLTAKVVDGVRM